MSFFSRLVDPKALPPYKKSLPILSPVSGRVFTLDNVPDALFTQRIYGEGVAIEPSGYQIFAPFSGKVEQFPESAHQLRIVAKNGLKMQIQMGINSHRMMGEGFKRKVKVGELFKQGQVLAEFDLRKMKLALDCTLCPVTIINSDKIAGIQAHCYQVIATEDHAMTVYI
ncbi:MAG: PTS system glucose-specific IIA component [Paraglaciecola sp.]|jgi:PTS system glucose-specific IIA component